MKEESSGSGLQILLTVVTFIFLIGLIIFIFSLIGGEIISVTGGDGSGTINESINFTQSGYSTSVAGLTNVQLSNYNVYKCNPNCTLVPQSNYTITGGVIYKV